MSTAPTRMITELHGEIRELERSRQALEQGLAEAEQGEHRTAAGLAAVQKRITARTYEAVPDPADAGIPRRIEAAVESVCASAARALAQRWAEIRAVLKEALSRVLEKLDGKRRELRRHEGELLGRNAGGQDGGRPGYGSSG